VDFSKVDVEARASARACSGDVRPWTRQARFSSAALAKVLPQVAAGEPLAVARLLAEAVDLAVATGQRVRAIVAGRPARPVISGGYENLDEAYDDCLAMARDTWLNWPLYLTAPADPADPAAGVRLYFEDRTALLPRDPGPADAPDWLAGAIRDRFLEEAAIAAADADWALREECDAYHHHLLRLGRQLSALGHDLAGSPLGLWTDPELARYAARLLSRDLADGEPDAETLRLYTEPLRSIADGVYAGLDGPRPLRDAERACLEAFFAALDPDVLRQLAEAEAGPAGWATPYDWQPTVCETVANGLLLLTDPALGGIDPAGEAGRARLPQEVRGYLYPQGGRLFSGDPAYRGYPMDAAAQRFRIELSGYNGFGALLAHATVPPGAAFARDLARSAVAVQTRSAMQYDGLPESSLPLEPGGDVERNTGSSALLRVAALNARAAAALLADRHFARLLLSRQWDDSAGAAEFVTAGAGADEAAAAVVRAVAGEDAEAVAGRGVQAFAGYTDHRALRQAVAALLREPAAVASRAPW
jgi:hypothetical protein